MVEIVVGTLKGGVEMVILLALLSAYLKATGRQELIRPLGWGAFFGLPASVALAYAGKYWLEREVVEGAANLLAALFALLLIAWMGWRYARAGRRAPSRKSSPASALLFFGSSLILTALGALGIARDTAMTLAKSGGLNSEQVLATGTILVTIGFAMLVGTTLYKLIAHVEPRWLTLVVGLTLALVAIRAATAVVQAMLVRGILPLTDWLFRTVAVLVNNVPAYYYVLFAAACLLVVLAGGPVRGLAASMQPVKGWGGSSGRNGSSEELNPAERRKLRAMARRMRTLTATVAILLAVTILVDRAGTAYANRPLTLSPPTPVAARGNIVVIPIDSVVDGKLHPFSYETGDGIAVRFLAIHKGSGVFGVALDACEFCGAAGYRQEGKNVVCNRCGAAINIATVGFPGGCNPIPLSHHKDETALTIPVEALKAAKGVFAQ